MNLKKQYMKTNEIIELVRYAPLFSKLNESELEVLINASSFNKAGKNSLIFSQGDETENIFFLIGGIIKLGSFDPVQNKEIINSIVNGQTLIGEQSVLGAETYDCNAKVISSQDAVYLAIPKKVFKFMLRSNFDFNLTFLEYVGNNIRSKDTRIESLVLRDARFRVIEFIKQNANKFGKKVGFETLIQHPLTQQDIANYTGTSRQTVTTILNELKKANKIFVKRKSILVRDLESIA